MTENPLGSLHVTDDGRHVLRFERRLWHPVRKVWKAVTDPAEMAHWFPANVEVEPRAGAPMRFSFEGEHLDVGERFRSGEVIEFDPPKVYAFRWHDSVLRIELVPEDGGCRLIFSETLSGTGTWSDRPSTARQAPGWDACLDWLVVRLDGGDKAPMAPDWFLRRSERYVEEFGLGEGELRVTEDGHLLRFERDLTHAPQEVWATLVEDNEPVVGQEPPVRFTHGYLTPGAVTEVAPPHVLEYTWLHDQAPAGRIRFELNVQEPIGCRLVLTQTLPARLAGQAPVALAAWQVHLELLFAALYGDVRCPWPTERTEQLTKVYADRLT